MVLPERVIAYVDGFNLYFGLRSSQWRRYYWLNIQQLVRQLLKGGQQLVFTHYFTARVSKPAGKNRRQNTFLEALQTLSDFKITYGKYQLNPHRCPHCHEWENMPNEKMTDVNIAVGLLTDAFQDRFDAALLISADSDLRAPIDAVERLFPRKRVIVAFPPNRVSKELRAIATGYISIGENELRQNQFPDEVVKPNGFILRRPAQWR